MELMPTRVDIVKSCSGVTTKTAHKKPLFYLCLGFFWMLYSIFRPYDALSETMKHDSFNIEVIMLGADEPKGRRLLMTTCIDGFDYRILSEYSTAEFGYYLPRLIGSQTVPYCTTMESTSPGTMTVSAENDEDAFSFTIDALSRPIAIRNDRLVCVNANSDGVLVYNSEGEIEHQLELQVEPAFELAGIYITEHFVLCTVVEKGESIKEKGSIDCYMNDERLPIGRGYFPFELSDHEIGYVSDGAIYRYSLQNSSVTPVLDKNGNMITIDVSPYFSPRIIYDPRTNGVFYVKHADRGYLGNIFADDSWGDIIYLSLTDGHKERIKIGRFIYAIYAF